MTFDLIIKETTVTYISWSSDFVLYLEGYLMDECHTLGYNRTFDLELIIDHNDLYFMVQ